MEIRERNLQANMDMLKALSENVGKVRDMKQPTVPLAPEGMWAPTAMSAMRNTGATSNSTAMTGNTATVSSPSTTVRFSSRVQADLKALSATSATSAIQSTGATANSTATTGNTATTSSPSTTVRLSDGARAQLEAEKSGAQVKDTSSGVASPIFSDADMAAFRRFRAEAEGAIGNFKAGGNLSQAGTQVLSQANQQTQGVLGLLG